MSDFVHPYQKALVEDIRAFLLHKSTAIEEMESQLRWERAIQWVALGAELFIFSAVLVWSSDRPVTGLDGTEVWQYSLEGILIALIMGFLAPICTVICTPFRDENNRIRVAAIMGWLGMVLIWEISVTEFIARLGIATRLAGSFGISPDAAWLLNLVLFFFGICLFSAFNHIYRGASTRIAALRKQKAAVETFKNIDQAVTEGEEAERVIKGAKDAELQWETDASAINSKAIQTLAEAQYSGEMQKKDSFLNNSTPHPHAGKRAHQVHQEKRDRLRNTINQEKP